MFERLEAVESVSANSNGVASVCVSLLTLWSVSYGWRTTTTTTTAGWCYGHCSSCCCYCCFHFQFTESSRTNCCDAFVSQRTSERLSLGLSVSVSVPWIVVLSFLLCFCFLFCCYCHCCYFTLLSSSISTMLLPTYYDYWLARVLLFLLLILLQLLVALLLLLRLLHGIVMLSPVAAPQIQMDNFSLALGVVRPSIVAVLSTDVVVVAW